MTVQQNFSKTGDRVGLALIATSGLASSLSTGILLLYIMWHAFLTPEKSSPVHRGVRSFTRSSPGCYLISLLFCDFLQGSAFILNYRWASQGVMDEGKLCTIQGWVSEIGDLGAALWSMAIAGHTFSLLFLVRKPHFLVAPIVLVLGWSSLIILPILGPTIIQTTRRGSFYGLSGAWCWIGVGYGTERLLYLYVWVFSALCTSFVIYTLIYLRFANIITIGDKGQLTVHFRRTEGHDVLQSAVSNPRIGTEFTSEPWTSRRLSSSLPGCFDWARDTRDGVIASNSGNTSDVGSPRSSAPVSKHLKQVARRLMWYPILYAIVVLPVSVCRMGVLAGWTPPFDLLVFSGVCFSGSGTTNAILFIFTRHSFIRKVVKSHGTRIHVTTQRITVDEDGVDVELSNMGTGGTASAALKSPYFLNGSSTPSFPEDPTVKARFENDSEYESEDMNTARIHISVFGK